MINYFKFIFIASFLLLSACNFTKPLEWVYYDRTKFTFMSEEDDTEYVYLCSKGKTEEKTKKRANEANTFFIEKINKLSEEFAEALMSQFTEKEAGSTDDDDGFSFTDSIKATLKLQKQAEKLAEDVEKQYQCLLIDTIEQ